jgi:hypothetical protein
MKKYDSLKDDLTSRKRDFEKKEGECQGLKEKLELIESQHSKTIEKLKSELKEDH